MNVREVFARHAFFLILMFLWMLLCDGVLYGMGIAWEVLAFLNVMSGCMVCTYIIKVGRQRSKRKKEIERIAQTLDQKYLLQEVLGHDKDPQEQFYAYLLRLGNKSMLEKISEVKRERLQYQEYVEQWVHEIKTPIAALKLQCENVQDKRKRDMLQQVERVEHYVEQALFYARSENVEKDLRIQYCDLYDCCSEALLQCKYLCTSAFLQIHFAFTSAIVATDEKWVIFILNQLIENAVKYRKEKAHLYLYITHDASYVTLHVQDNGAGIPMQDQTRIFEKGFTGENGRKHNQHATGIGLYLCKRLCDALQIEIMLRSKEGVFTDMQLRFHK